jgi:hypothetical protein
MYINSLRSLENEIWRNPRMSKGHPHANKISINLLRGRRKDRRRHVRPHFPFLRPPALCDGTQYALQRSLTSLGLLQLPFHSSTAVYFSEGL